MIVLNIQLKRQDVVEQRNDMKRIWLACLSSNCICEDGCL